MYNPLLAWKRLFLTVRGVVKIRNEKKEKQNKKLEKGEAE
jgi:hypothetical protein